jgi:hypothetical protein
MLCVKCMGEIRFFVDEFVGTVTFNCPCRDVMIPILGVKANEQPNPTLDSASRPDVHSGGGGEASGWHDSSETSERDPEVAAATESKVAEAESGKKVADAGTVS